MKSKIYKRGENNTSQRYNSYNRAERIVLPLYYSVHYIPTCLYKDEFHVAIFLNKENNAYKHTQLLDLKSVQKWKEKWFSPDDCTFLGPRKI